MLKRALHTLTFCLLGMVALGCSSTDTIDPQPVPLTIPQNNQQFTFPRLDPTNGVIPLPNTLLNVTPGSPGPNALPGTGDTIDSVNSLSNWSTSGNIIVPFAGSVDPTTVNGTTLPIYNEATNTPVNMSYQVVNDAQGNSTVIATPVLPLASATNYVGVVTSGVRRLAPGLPGQGTPVLSEAVTNFSKTRTRLIDTNGNSVVPTLSNAQANQLEPLRLAMQGTWAQAEGASGLLREDIPLAFRFRTQVLNARLPFVRGGVVNANRGINPGTVVVAPNVWFAGLPAALQGALAAVPLANINRVAIGTMPSPNYRGAAALTTFWNEANLSTSSDRNIPFVAFLPAGNGPHPTIIFQHGITVSKEFASIIAAAFNPQGIAVIALDLELHGQLTEGASSGDGFINPANLRNTRDNIRQSVVNLYALNQAIVSGQTDFDGAGADLGLAPVPPFFLGHSLGGIVGTIFVATETNVGRAVINAAGGRLTALLINSPTIFPPILAGLNAAGIQANTPEFVQFFFAAQTVVDDADPINYAALAGAKTGAGSVMFHNLNTDTVVPPSAQQDLVRAAGQAAAFRQVDAVISLAPFVAQAASPFTGSGSYEIINSGHSILLDPTATTLPNTQADIFAQIGAFYTAGAITNTNIRVRAILGDMPEDTRDYGSVVGFYPE